ncbi:FAD-dependent oxidoreductase [uncultured Shimia sp.]|uniref:NAD(P)/FAD-dependent oxidoreductase n=1 Tax=uncultured Shimia sp. TaxID=573152 RepID=UPI00262CB6FB|nr:FAD-dependent oxidoreductase [uncultured Shimia sp.]
MTAQKTIVIGAGIIGCSIACALAAGGSDVVVLDAGRVAGDSSGRSFGWINASFHANEHHYHLRCEGIAAWRRLEAERGALPISWGGAVCWEEQGAALAAQRDRLRGLGYEVSHLQAEALQHRLPGISGLPDEALVFPQEGVAETSAVTQALARDAATFGARFLTGVKALEICEVGGRVTGVRTQQGVIPADRVTLAAGVGSHPLLSPLDVALPMLPRPGLLLTTVPIPKVLDTVLVTPEGEIRQLADGRIMMPTSVGHQADTTEEITQTPDKIANSALDRIRHYFPQHDLSLEEVTLAWRPVPGDGLPVVGPTGLEGLYVSVMHSGITLAAVMAEMVSAELQTGVIPDLLGPYRPSRFQ